MALVSLLVSKVTGVVKGTRFSYSDQIKDGKLTALFIDATLTESHQFETDVVENPVEQGVKITDHIDLKPEQFTLTGVISDTPLDLQASLAGASTAVGALVGKTLAGPIGSFSSIGAGSLINLAAKPDNHMKNTFDALRAIQLARVPFSVITGLRKYENMVITSARTMSRDGKSGRSFNFTATLKQVRIVQSQVTSAAPCAIPFYSGAAKANMIGPCILP